MTDDDVSEIAELEKKCFAVPWSEKSFRDEMQNKLAVYFVAKDNGKCIGYAGFWNVSGEGDITNVAVLPEYRKNGIGSMLISEMIKTAVTLKLELLTLEVRKSNIAAQGLYKKYGFDIIGERKRYYSDNGEDAWIMTKALNRVRSDNVLILGIESSCDETAAAVVKDGREVLSNVINTQIALHKKFGGVVPEVASRRHIETIDAVIDGALEEANVTFDDIDAIAVTYGPGLVGALLVGVSTAKALAFALNKPLVPVHHIKGHIMANFVAHKDLEPPFVCLVASGGHSHIVSVEDYTHLEIMGRTRDDAAGEAFDKIARVLGLGYPGGPLIDKLAKEGNPKAVDFPRVRMDKNSLDFSFSGVKTAVINYLHKLEQNGEEYNKADIAASFQDAVTDVLCEHTIEAAEQKNSKIIALAGGVASNSALREKMTKLAGEKGIKVVYPEPILCTDNAVMIACAGYYGYLEKNFADMTLNAIPSLSL